MEDILGILRGMGVVTDDSARRLNGSSLEATEWVDGPCTRDVVRICRAAGIPAAVTSPGASTGGLILSGRWSATRWLTLRSLILAELTGALPQGLSAERVYRHALNEVPFEAEPEPLEVVAVGLVIADLNASDSSWATPQLVRPVRAAVAARGGAKAVLRLAGTVLGA